MEMRQQPGLQTLLVSPRDFRRCLLAAFALLIPFLASLGVAQAAPPTSARKPAPASTTQSAPAMVPNQNQGTLLQAPKTNPIGLMTPALVGGDVEKMSHEQFRALPDTASIRYRGQGMSKGAFIQQRLREWNAAPVSIARKPMMDFQTLKTQFEQKQAAELQAQNARVQAVAERLTQRLKQAQSSPEYLALLKEAGDLQRRYASASPDEKSRLKVRALQIHEELARLERVE
jgi:hypothetical protein